MTEWLRQRVDKAQNEQRQRAYNAGMARSMEKWGPYIDWSVFLEGEGDLSSRLLIQAFKRVRRIDFLPDANKKEVGYNGPVSIGHGQFNSQPSVVALMLEALMLEPGDFVLDFGAGSGWTTALMAAVVKRKGRVTGTEIVPPLVTFGNTNLAKYQFRHARMHHTPDQLGFPKDAPYDAILVSARLPEEWLPELTVQLHPEGGRLVAPVSTMGNYKAGNVQDLIRVTRDGSKYETENLGQQVAFVPTVRYFRE